MKVDKISGLFSLLLLLPVLGCAGHLPVGKNPAEPAAILSTSRELLSLPKPKGRIPVAVYSFRDQTGQYKHHPTSSTFSTAVTQGATAMLVEALLQSGWFIPLEREGLNDLLTERKIIRAKLGEDKATDLPVLRHAPLLLEGGIVAYETNLITGGLGAKYFGAGGSAEIRRDQVTLTLRSVDVMKGEVLHSISTTKSILSEQVDFGVFRFVKTNRLLEIETGFSSNEPPQLCVREAIEMAVINLVIEGVVDGSWALDNPADINAPIFRDYLSTRQARPVRYSEAGGETSQEEGESAARGKVSEFLQSGEEAGSSRAEQPEFDQGSDPVIGPPPEKTRPEPEEVNGPHPGVAPETKSEPRSSSPAWQRQDLLLEVLNGNGVRLMAKTVGDFLAAKGYTVTRTADAGHHGYSETVILHPAGYREAAAMLAGDLPGRIRLQEESGLEGGGRIEIHLIVGRDLAEAFSPHP